MFLAKDITQVSEDGQFFYIDLRPWSDVYLKYSSWGKGLKIYRHDASGWKIEKHDPEIALINPEHDTNPDLPIHEFIESIPSAVHTQKPKFAYLQTTLLQLTSRIEESIDLLNDIPVLLWLLADFYRRKHLSI